MRKRAAKKAVPPKDKSLESWIWDAACSIRGAKDAPNGAERHRLPGRAARRVSAAARIKYKDYILPLIFTKRLCDVFDDELDRIAKEVGSRKKAFALVKADPKLVRFYLPLVPDDPEQPVWSVIRKLSDQIGEGVTTHMRAIAKENPKLKGIIDRVDFNATVHGQRELDDDRLSNLIEAISTKRLGLDDVEADIIGKSYGSKIRRRNDEGRKRPQGPHQTVCAANHPAVRKPAKDLRSAGAGKTTAPLGNIRWGELSGGLSWTEQSRIHCEMWRLATRDRRDSLLARVACRFGNRASGQAATASRRVRRTDRHFRHHHQACKGQRLKTPHQLLHSPFSLQPFLGRAAVVLDTGAASRGSGNAGTNKEKTVRQWFVEHEHDASVQFTAA